MLVEKIEVPAVEKGQEATPKNDRSLVEMNGVDQVHHASPKAELPKDGRDDDFFGFFRMEPLQNKAAAKREAGDKTQYGPPARTPIKPRDVTVEERGEKTFSGWVHQK